MHLSPKSSGPVAAQPVTSPAGASLDRVSQGDHPAMPPQSRERAGPLQ
jgi:hypothetical protein